MPDAGRLVALLLCAVFGGCGGEDPPAKDTTDGPPAGIAAFCADFATARCAARAACCDADADCATTLRDGCLADTAALADAIGAGSAQLDDAAIAACLADHSGAADACALPAAGLRCDAESETCVTSLGEGSACKAPGSCASGLGCDATSWTCKILPKQGQACLMGMEACAPGLQCLNYVKGGGTCEPPGGASADCVKHNNCAAGFACDFGIPGPSGKGGSCVAAPKNGKPCMDGFVCGEGYCSHADGKTVCTAYVALGAPCPGGNECGPGRACVPDAANALRCVVLPALDEPCLFECADDAVCRRKIEPGVCQRALCSR